MNAQIARSEIRDDILSSVKNSSKGQLDNKLEIMEK
jgi:hypothetical protein